MADPYKVEIDKKGCEHCGAETYWTVVGPDDVAIGTSWADEETAQDIADLMNMAHDAGRESVPSENALTAAARVRKVIDDYLYVTPPHLRDYGVLTDRIVSALIVEPLYTSNALSSGRLVALECIRMVEEYNDQNETGDVLKMLAENIRSYAETLPQSVTMTCPQCGWRAAVPDGWLAAQSEPSAEAEKRIADAHAPQIEEAARNMMYAAVIGVGIGPTPKPSAPSAEAGTARPHPQEIINYLNECYEEQSGAWPLTKVQISKTVVDDIVTLLSSAPSSAPLTGETPITDELCRRLQGNPPVSFTESDAEELATHARQLERDLAEKESVISLTRTILAGMDAGSLPNDFPVDGMAAERMKDLLNTRRDLSEAKQALHAAGDGDTWEAAYRRVNEALQKREDDLALAFDHISKDDKEIERLHALVERWTKIEAALDLLREVPMLHE